jgi:hypothetical protein
MILTTGIKRLLIGGVLIAGIGASAAKAALVTFTTFTPTPISPTMPEIIWTNSGVVGTSALTPGSGSASNGDGTQSTLNQTQPGLQVHTFFSIPFAASFGGTNNIDGSTTFYDVSLSLTGLNDNGPAIGTSIAQPLTGGTFAFFSTTDVEATGGVQPLLTGTLDNAVLTGFAGSTQGAALSATITYTGGLIYNAYLAAGGTDNSGGMSWTLQLSPPMSIGANGRTSSFTANTSGEYNIEEVVPEPGSLSLLAIAGAAMLASRRRAA